MLDTWMLSKPGASLGTIVTTEIVTNHINVACRIGRFDVSEQGNVTFGIARSRTASDLLAITDPQGPIDPHLLLATAVIQRGFDAMSVSRPGGGSFTSARIRLRSSSVKRGLRPDPDRIRRPLIPSLLKRARWVRTVFGWHFSSVAIP